MSDLKSVYERAMKRYPVALDADSHNRARMREDLRFLQGEGQWDDTVRQERKAAKRPTMVFDHMTKFVNVVANQVRMKPPSIKVSPSEDGDLNTAEVYEGLIRVMERQSGASRIYARAGRSAAECGIGYWRIDTEYEDDDGFNQTVKIRGVNDPFAVVYDHNGICPLKSDAEFCFVVSDITREEFQAKYGDADTVGFDHDPRYNRFKVGETVTIAEYWEVTKEPDTLYLLSDGSTIKASNEKALTEAMQNGLAPVNERPCYNKVVTQYIIAGNKVLAKPKVTVFERIPIIPVLGHEMYDGDRTWRSGLITPVKDAQRLLNYWHSAAVERLALAPKAPWLVTPKNVEGFETEWKKAATGNPAFLPFNPDPVVGKPERMAPQPIEAGMLQQAEIAEAQMKAITGIYDASLGNRSNETSGVAIEARKVQGDIGTFEFVDNVLAAVEETGRVLVKVIPKLYDIPRRVRILGKKMEPKIVEVNQGEIDLSRGAYDVVVSAGASVLSQRQEAAEMFIEALRSAPMLAPVLIPRLVGNMDLPDAEEISKEIKQVMQPQPQQPQVNPKDEAQAAKYAAEAEGQQLTNFQTKMQLGYTMGTMSGLGGGQPQAQGLAPAPDGFGVNPPNEA